MLVKIDLCLKEWDSKQNAIGASNFGGLEIVFCIVSNLTLYGLVLLQNLDKSRIGPHKLLNSSSVESRVEVIGKQKTREKEKELLPAIEASGFASESLSALPTKEKEFWQGL